jgi:4-hydroxy-3-methylbut-2-enyl diphosphate reductase
MMRGETEEVQRRIMAAVQDRDGADKAQQNYRFFDTICGATQERQDALQQMLDNPLDLLVVVGGYNSSNTSHLAEMGEAKLPTYFIRNASRLESRDRIVHYNLHKREEIVTENWLPPRPLTVGITAGASCPNNLIEEAILRLFALHGISAERLLGN